MDILYEVLDGCILFDSAGNTVVLYELRNIPLGGHAGRMDEKSIYPWDLTFVYTESWN
jgi:hypothetical protein